MKGAAAVSIGVLALAMVTCTAPDFEFRQPGSGGAASSAQESVSGGTGGSSSVASTTTSVATSTASSVASVGSTSTTSSTAMSSSASSSAGAGGSSMLPPLAQHCFITICNVGEVCCIDASNPSSHTCKDPPTCDPATKVPAHCTANADCVDPSATHCCGNVIASTLISTICQTDVCNPANQVRMCNYFAGSNPECTGAEVCNELFTLTSPYGYCQ